MGCTAVFRRLGRVPPWSSAWQPIAAEQHGIIARPQLLALGLSGSQARRFVANRQWRTVLPGVYTTQIGLVSDQAMGWAALLYAGEGAALSHATALWLDGVLDGPPDRVQLTVPERRRVAPQDGLRIHRSVDLPAAVHPSRSPTRTRIEHSVLDHLEGADSATVIDVLTRSTQRRLTTAARLRDTLARRRRHSNRTLIAEVLGEVEDGVQSPLERRYLRDVERAHDLPAATRNCHEVVDRRSRYRDVRYRNWSVVVELDGRAAHPAEGAFRDLRRDNELVLSGDAVLRFGWRDVVGRPCAVAAQVALALGRQGWTDRPRPCGDGCSIRRAA